MKTYSAKEITLLSMKKQNEYHKIDKSCSGKLLNMNREHKTLVYHE